MAHGMVKPCPRLGLEITCIAIRGGGEIAVNGVGWGSRVNSEAGAAGRAQANGYRIGRFRADGPRAGGSRAGIARDGIARDGIARDGIARGGRPWVAGCGPNRLRSFSPLRVGHLEAAVWVAYYQRE